MTSGRNILYQSLSKARSSSLLCAKSDMEKHPNRAISQKPISLLSWIRMVLVCGSLDCLFSSDTDNCLHTGTDATIAQHIQTIIDRSYVIERMQGSTKYLVPSTLGIGLIEGYNQIGLAKSVSKPLLRREVSRMHLLYFPPHFCDSQTERRMVRICEGTTTKQEMLDQSLEQYKEMFVIVKREFNRVTAVCYNPNFTPLC